MIKFLGIKLPPLIMGKTPLLAFCIACNVIFGALACVVYRYDLSYINSLSRKDAYEHAHLVAALQVLL